MEQTLYASFESIDRAKEAIGELICAGARPDDLAIACRSSTFHQIGASPDAPPSASGAGEIGRHPEIRARGSEPPDSVIEDQTLGAMPETIFGMRVPGPGAMPHADGFSDAAGTRAAEIAATAGASANPGEMTDYLWDSLPIDVVPLYRKDYHAGKAIVFVRHANDESREILQRNEPARLDGRG